MARVPKLRPGCDIKSLPLIPKEAFLLSSIDGRADEHELGLVTGFTGTEVLAMLDRLAALGAIEVTGTPGESRPQAPAPERAPSAASQTHLRAAPDPIHDSPTVEDPGVARRQALARKLSGTLPAVTPPGVRAPTPPVRPWTPAVRPSTAGMHAVTPPVRPSTPGMRAPTPPDPADIAAVAQYDQAVAGARQAELLQALERGKSALASKDFNGAVSAYRMALSLAEDDPRVQAVCNDAIQHASAELADGYWAQAVEQENEGRWEEAALSYAKVCTGRPGDALAHERVANAALRSSNVRRAVEFARRAIELSPSTAVYRVTLARAYAAAGLEKSSHGELARALELAPNDARIQNLVSRARALVGKSARTG